MGFARLYFFQTDYFSCLHMQPGEQGSHVPCYGSVPVTSAWRHRDASRYLATRKSQAQSITGNEASGKPCCVDRFFGLNFRNSRQKKNLANALSTVVLNLKASKLSCHL